MLTRKIVPTLVLLLISVATVAQINTTPFAHAIAKAEGYGVKRAIPTRYHNPGDLKAVHNFRYPGQIAVGKGGHVIFRTDADGWAALDHQIYKMAYGSRLYKPTMTLSEIGRKYAGDRHWSAHVAKNFGCSPQVTLAEILEIPPTYSPSWEVL
jgi:hypothetical protein